MGWGDVAGADVRHADRRQAAVDVADGERCAPRIAEFRAEVPRLREEVPAALLDAEQRREPVDDDRT
jgi:hypothetical protein